MTDRERNLTTVLFFAGVGIMFAAADLAHDTAAGSLIVIAMWLWLAVCMLLGRRE